EKRVPKIIAQGRKRAAQVSAGRLRSEVQEKEAQARNALDAAGRRIRGDESMRIELPDPGVPRARRIATLGSGDRTWLIQGPERVGLIGANGVGKTTLLRGLVRGEAGADAAIAGADAVTAVAHTDRIGYLSQRVDGLADARSVFENVA